MEKIILDDKNTEYIKNKINNFFNDKVVLETMSEKSIFTGYCDYHPLKDNDNSSASLAIFNRYYDYPCLPICNGTKIRIDESQLFIEGPFIGCLFFSKEDYSNETLVSYYKKILKFIICEKMFNLEELRIEYVNKLSIFNEIEDIFFEEINNMDFINTNDNFSQFYIEYSLWSSDLYILNINLKKWIETGDLNNIYFENYLYEKVNMEEELEKFIKNKNNEDFFMGKIKRITGYLGSMK